jgi:hypothetical protein
LWIVFGASLMLVALESWLLLGEHRPAT